MAITYLDILIELEPLLSPYLANYLHPDSTTVIPAIFGGQVIPGERVTSPGIEAAVMPPTGLQTNVYFGSQIAQYEQITGYLYLLKPWHIEGFDQTIPPAYDSMHDPIVDVTDCRGQISIVKYILEHPFWKGWCKVIGTGQTSESIETVQFLWTPDGDLV